MFVSAQFLVSLSICFLVNELRKPGEMAWKPVCVGETDIKVKGCGDRREDLQRRLSVPWTPCAHKWVSCERERKNAGWMLWAEGDSVHISVCMLLKVLLPVKAGILEKTDKSLVISRNYFHTWITLLNMWKQLYLKHFPFLCIFFYLMPFCLLLLNVISRPCG